MLLWLIWLCCFFEICKANCLVKENQSNRRKPCVFPFVLQNSRNEPRLVLQRCTTILGPDERPWCSTKTNATGHHQQGHWGLCDEGQGNCPLPEGFKEVSEIVSNLEDLGNGFRSCPCKPYLACDWSRKLWEYLPKLPRSGKLRKTGDNLRRKLVCDNRSRAVYCCSKDKSGSPKIDQRSGLWKPSDAKGECGTRLTGENIIGGEIAKLGEFPYMALLGFRIQGQVFYTCGGSIVNSKYILTAAHCLDNRNQPLVEVVVGEHTLGNDPDCKDNFCLTPQKLKVESIKIHEKWNGNAFKTGNDIALVRVQGNIKLFDDPECRGSNPCWVFPVCLPWNRNDPGRNIRLPQNATVTGWGRVTNDRAQSDINFLKYQAATRTLQKVKIPIVGFETCSKDHDFTDKNQFICAGKPGKDSCQGDSGSPLVVRKGPGEAWFQTGIVSFGSTVCGSSRPGVYTRVSNFIDWISDSLEA